ncbi:ProQ/FINO family protein [Onishia taeanensis]
MNNERTAALLATLEACANKHLDELVRARAQVTALQEQNRRLEASRRDLEQHGHELALKHQALEEKCRELEEKFARAPHTADGHAHPRSQGLAALLTHRVRQAAPAPHVPAVTESPSPLASGGEASPESEKTARDASEGSAEGAAAGEPAEARAANEDLAPHKEGGAKEGGAREGSATSPQSARQAEVLSETTPARTLDASQVPAPQAKPGTEPSAPSRDDMPSPQALLSQWYRRYPDAFFKGHTRPLRVGIHEDLLAREPWPEKLVRRALACYVHLPRYLKAVREHAERVGLDGEAAGPVSEGEARYARKKLDELRAQQQAERAGKKSGPDDKKSGQKGGNENGNKGKKGGNQGRQQSVLTDTQPSRVSAEGASRAPTHEASTAQAPGAAPASSQVPTPPTPASQEAPAERMERKLGALLAKHSSR